MSKLTREEILEKGCEQDPELNYVPPVSTWTPLAQKKGRRIPTPGIPKNVLTMKRLEILGFIRRYNEQNPWCVSFQDIMDCFGIATKSVCFYHLKFLIDGEYLGCLLTAKGRMAPRTLHVTDKGINALL